MVFIIDLCDHSDIFSNEFMIIMITSSNLVDLCEDRMRIVRLHV